MEKVKPKLSWKTVVFPIIGLVAFFLYIYLYNVDIITIISNMQKANPAFFIIAVLCGILEVLFFTISWRSITNHLDIKMSLKKAYLYVWYGLYVDIVIPAESISGEIVRTYLLTRDKCGSLGKIVASLFTHRLIGTVMNIVVLVLGLALFPFEGQMDATVFNIIAVVTVGITAALVGMIVFSLKENWMLKVIDWATKAAQFVSRGKWKLTKLREQAVQIASHFHQSMHEFQHNPWPIIKSTFFMIITWVFTLAIPYFVFLSLGYSVSWSMLLITSAIVLAVKSIPVGIFEVGIPEITMTTLFTAFLAPTLGPIAAEVSATATVLTRIITLWFRFFGGFAAQQYLELKPVLSKPKE
ncbi:MAG: flippase-like domain-containing protein [Candidatus Bathyarchaeota archaeon]|nr:flippase-like domain-containing protein [Candidatus Bathyarchaeota archaeon]